VVVVWHFQVQVGGRLMMWSGARSEGSPSITDVLLAITGRTTACVEGKICLETRGTSANLVHPLEQRGHHWARVSPDARSCQPSATWALKRPRISSRREPRQPGGDSTCGGGWRGGPLCRGCIRGFMFHLVTFFGKSLRCVMTSGLSETSHIMALL